MTNTDPDPVHHDDEESPRMREIEKAFAPIARVFGYLLVWWVGVSIASSFVVPLVPDLGPADLRFLSAIAFPNAAATVLLTIGFVRYIDQQPVRALGFCREGSWLAELGFGLLLGTMLVGMVFLVAFGVGWVRITGSIFRLPSGSVTVLLFRTLVTMVGIAIMEETAMRGYILRTLKNGYGSVVGLIVSAAFFGLLHFANPGAGPSALIGTLVAGLLLGYAYLATERLWLPIGIHFGWNFALGPIFGFPVSGIDIPGWVIQDSIGPVLWTGGVFGPEAGLLGLIALVIGALAVFWFRSRWYRTREPVLETVPVPAENDEEDGRRAA